MSTERNSRRRTGVSRRRFVMTTAGISAAALTGRRGFAASSPKCDRTLQGLQGLTVRDLFGGPGGGGAMTFYDFLDHAWGQLSSGGEKDKLEELRDVFRGAYVNVTYRQIFTFIPQDVFWATLKPKLGAAAQFFYLPSFNHSNSNRVRDLLDGWDETVVDSSGVVVTKTAQGLVDAFGPTTSLLDFVKTPDTAASPGSLRWKAHLYLYARRFGMIPPAISPMTITDFGPGAEYCAIYDGSNYYCVFTGNPGDSCWTDGMGNLAPGSNLCGP